MGGRGIRRPSEALSCVSSCAQLPNGRPGFTITARLPALTGSVSARLGAVVWGAVPTLFAALTGWGVAPASPGCGICDAAGCRGGVVAAIAYIAAIFTGHT